MDETGSIKALDEGFLPNERAYSVAFWGSDYAVTTMPFEAKLNQAKTAIKQALKGYHHV